MTKTEQYFDILTKMLASVHYEVEPTHTVGKVSAADQCAAKYNNILAIARGNAMEAIRDVNAFEAKQAQIDAVNGRIDLARHRYFDTKSDEERNTLEKTIEALYAKRKELYEKEV